MLVPKCWSHVTIEPALVISFVVSTITSLGLSNLMLQKLCYKNGTGPVLGVICPNELTVQKEVALVQSYRVSLEIFCKVLIIIISSSWKRSRKPYFLLPMCGHIMLDLLNIGVTYFWQSSIWILATGNGILSGITGTGCLTTIGATLYASDNTTPEQRTLRIGIYEFIYACSAPVGAILSGYLTLLFGFYVIFILSVVGNSIAFILILVTIREPHLAELPSKREIIKNPLRKDIRIAKDNYFVAQLSESSEPKEKRKTLQDQIDDHYCKNSEENGIADSHKNDQERLHPITFENKILADETVKGNEIKETVKDQNDANPSESSNVNSTAPQKTFQNNNTEREKDFHESVRNHISIEEDTKTTRVSTISSTKAAAENPKKSFEDVPSKLANSKINVAENLNPFKMCLNNFRILLKPRGNHRTTVALLMIFIVMVLDAALVGEYNLLYLYVRAKFGWNERDYGTYAAYKAWVATFGVLFSVGLLGRVFKLKDTSIGLLACVSSFLESLAYMFVTTSFQMFMVPLIDMFHVAAFVVALSILSQEIDVLELPNVLSVHSIMSTCLPVLTTPIYMLVYKHTVDVWPAAFFVLGVTLSIPAFIGFGIVKYLLSRRMSPTAEEIT